jgi:hypothetical protein
MIITARLALVMIACVDDQIDCTVAYVSATSPVKRQRASAPVGLYIGKMPKTTHAIVITTDAPNRNGIVYFW